MFNYCNVVRDASDLTFAGYPATGYQYTKTTLLLCQLYWTLNTKPFFYNSNETKNARRALQMLYRYTWTTRNQTTRHDQYEKDRDWMLKHIIFFGPVSKRQPKNQKLTKNPAAAELNHYPYSARIYELDI